MRPESSLRMLVRGAPGPAAGYSGEAGAGETVGGLLEDRPYRIEVHPAAAARLFIDDAEVLRADDGAYCWRPAFFAGTVNAVVVEQSGAEHRFFLDVGPTVFKSGREQFNEMILGILAFDATLLCGASSATRSFASEERGGDLGLLVRLARLQQHGPAFLAAVRAMASNPHRSLRATSRKLPLSQLRKLHPSALRDRRLMAIAAGHEIRADEFDTLQLLTQAAAATADTPANRALGALLKRLRAAATDVLDHVEALRVGGEREEQLERQQRRRAFLQRLVAQAQWLLQRHPFRDLPLTDTTAAGLTQISAQPAYRRAHRHGCNAMRTGIDGDCAADSLPIPPSWGVYETWCFVAVVRLLGSITGRALVPCRSRIAGADLALQASLCDGTRIEILFQATFPSGGAYPHQRAWSLSRERRPDIVLVAERNGHRRLMVLDAKWRSGRENLLDAMTSAHVYHDSLRINSSRPDMSLLLLPGADEPSLSYLGESAFRETHGVGALSRFRPGDSGIEQCRGVLEHWLAACGHVPPDFPTDGERSSLAGACA